MAKLPNADRAYIDPAEITDYLLCPTHPKGGPKCAFFESFGFRPHLPDELAAALRLHATEHDIVKERRGLNGMKYEISGPLRTSDGRKPIVRTVWIVRFTETYPRFVTAVPD